MNLMITGASGSGKTTLCQRVIKAKQWVAKGFCTIRVFENSKTIGFDMVGLMDEKRQMPIVRFCKNENINVYEESFRTLGVELLENALNFPCDCILMDEIGRFEQNVSPFLDAVRKVLVQQKMPVLVVLKKEELPFNEEIKKNINGLFYDLDNQNRDEVFDLIMKKI